MSEALLELAVDILGPVIGDVVFVGGATIHPWVTEEAAPPVRATDDVDVICDVTSYGEYQAFADRLRECGLDEAMNENVICRWRHKESGLAIDVMPISEDVLGFSNPWYEIGIDTAVEQTLPSGSRIRAVAPPVVIATKLAAWLGRGKGGTLAINRASEVARIGVPQRVRPVRRSSASGRWPRKRRCTVSSGARCPCSSNRGSRSCRCRRRRCS